MNRKKYRPYFLLGLFLFSLFYLPGALIQGLRSGAGTISSEFWKKGRVLQASFVPSSSSKKEKNEVEALEVENLLLKRQIETLRRRLYSEDRVEHQLKKLKELITLDEKRSLDFFKRRKKSAEDLLNLELFSLSAEVIRRDLGEWNSSFWINVGSFDNEKLNNNVISEGSPVLKGSYLIGVIEEVGRHKSKVRLLTDGALVPSVRVARGGTQDREFKRDVKLIYNQAVIRGEELEILTALNKLLLSLGEEKEEKFYAKGELIGSSSSCCRLSSEILRGVGFNYDFEDIEGPALELRSGQEIERLNNKTYNPLIEVGDLLVTSGMDGIFPKDLPVAHVTYVAPLKEGSPSYEIEAKLCAGNLEALLEVSILPPLSLLEESMENDSL